MSFIMPVPSQEAAVEYINSTCQYIRGRLYIGGHSKGGNLAIYSAVKCSERVRKKIDCVYNNDGPGFDVNMIKKCEISGDVTAYQKHSPREFDSRNVT